ncbi:hypothetical protein P8452_06548 [Trifolium repens]|nr:hypothetical protein P8452_06548 [Trifolium repens]
MIIIENQVAAHDNLQYLMLKTDKFCDTASNQNYTPSLFQLHLLTFETKNFKLHRKKNGQKFEFIKNITDRKDLWKMAVKVTNGLQ